MTINHDKKKVNTQHVSPSQNVDEKYEERDKSRQTENRLCDFRFPYVWSNPTSEIGLLYLEIQETDVLVLDFKMDNGY